MNQPALNDEYLVAVDSPWIKEIRENVIAPYRVRVEQHPYMQEIVAGTLPVEKIRCFAQNTLWLINSFPQVMSTFAARCPADDHAFRKSLLANARSEHEHPFYMGRAVSALGADPGPILNGPV